jgi:hypothetical protein
MAATTQTEWHDIVASLGYQLLDINLARTVEILIFPLESEHP